MAPAEHPRLELRVRKVLGPGPGLELPRPGLGMLGVVAWVQDETASREPWVLLVAEHLLGPQTVLAASLACGGAAVAMAAVAAEQGAVGA